MTAPHTPRTWLRQHPRLVLALLFAAAVLVALWLLTRPGAPLGPRDLTWHRMQINKDFYVGLDPTYPPFAEWTPDGIVGLEADIAREIGRRLGVETSIQIMGYDSLYQSLYTGNVDMVIAGLTVDPAQDEWVHYTASYFDAGQVLVSQPQHAYQHIRELDGKTLAVEFATTGDMAAQRWTRRLQGLTVERKLLPQDAMQAVQADTIDAALVDVISARLYLATHPDLVMADATTVPEPFVIALRDDSFRLAAAVDDILAAMQRDGTLDALIAKWL